MSLIKNTINIIFLGQSKILKKSIEAARSLGIKNITIISLKKKIQPNNSINLKKYAEENNFRYFETFDINSNQSINYLKKNRPNIIFAQWPRIINDKILKIPTIGTIGSHPTDLPRNRGRHPLHWSIVLGFAKSKVSFFWMNKKIDDGKIILKKSYKINSNENILQLEKKIEKIFFSMTKLILKKILKGNKIKSISQNRKKTNFLRKRNIFDLIINLKMNYNYIKNLVNSFTTPYPCAIFIYEKNILRVKSVNLKKQKKLDTTEIGKILKINSKFLITRCADKVIQINFVKKYKIKKNSNYVYDPIQYVLKHNLKKLLND